MAIDLEKSCQIKCQEQEDGQPCEVYHKVKELLNQGNRGLMTEDDPKFD